ncbi:two-component sensor histidine kinase [Streptomyces sp. NP160]|uniref:sensor histidine kinase n=1 Tax=Streptomyces sp. NP160 TaxID=2586637 RepID=UPI001118B95F|nr:histidine kinase [Streptomyces sp. NP160]TNM63150.1 two-component sensor histidine kinase [Streptomyces sp. NP160]
MSTPADRRDAATALAWAALSAGVLVLLLGPVARSADVDVPALLAAGVVAVAVAQCLLLVLRHRRPAAVLALASALQALLLSAVPADTSLQGAGLLVAAYTAGTLLPGRRLALAVLASVAVQTVGLTAGSVGLTRAAPTASGALPVLGEVLLATAGAATTTGAAAAVGAWVGLRRAHQRSLLAAARAEVEHQAALARSAVAEERTRMARELHDVAAHHLSGIVVQASASERLVDADPERAKQAIRDLREQARATLHDMRSIVGILRASAVSSPAGQQDDDEGAPVPGLAQLPALVEAARAAGDEVQARCSGPGVVLPPLADLAVYRTAQEALANARRHAPGARVVLAVTTAPERVRLEVENQVPPTSAAGAQAPPGSGLGLTGMRERADLVRGHLQTGPTAHGSWRVVFEVPVPAAPTPEVEA